eukprot:TRINITY_DN1543_c0_g1_i1.p1 TRINITY_DN1543_c0_g1~~TRINITY_DN1543_c0_g1_i1.p1  ORF type:complete len:494 (-),score=132.98 TRINITY_DN1543_c0_g1_i1:257-1738(-)
MELAPPQDSYRDEIRSLPSAAFAAFKMSGLKEDEALKDWDIFMRCLYYCTPKKTFLKAPPLVSAPFQPSKLTCKEPIYPSPSTSSISSRPPIGISESQGSFSKEETEGEGSQSQYDNSEDCIKDLHSPTTSRSNTKSTQTQYEHFTNNERKTTKHVQIPNSGAHYSSFHDIKSSLESTSLPPSIVPSPENSKPNRKSSSRKKKFTQQDLEAMVTRKNPTELFILSRQAGKGSFGKVYVAIRRTDKRKFAMKMMKRSWKEDAQTTAQEISLLSSCHHQNIVGYTETFVWDEKVWIVMDYCDAGTLNELLVVDLNEIQIACIVSQVLEGLNYLHKLRRIHRDIKSHNILLNMNGDVKVADLGLCIEADESTSMAGSKYWIAPEVITGRYNNKCDIWSTGALVVEMAEGSAPYSKHKALKAMFLTATRGAPALQRPEKWSENFKDFLRLCFTVEADRRPSAEVLLTHPFLKGASSNRAELVKTMKLVFLLRVTTGI